jgi:hypothetical protein
MWFRFRVRKRHRDVIGTSCRCLAFGLTVTLWAAVATASDLNETDSLALRALVGRFTDSPAGRGSDPAKLGQECLASIALQSEEGDRAIRQMRKSADRLIELSDLAGDGKRGWTVDPALTRQNNCAGPGTLRPFNHPACNPRYTKYMFETAFAIACLAKATLVTHDDRYLKVAREAIAASWSIGTNVDKCPDCFYYWYSYSPNDVGRYVRNTNALMGMAIAWAWLASGDDSYRRRAHAVASSELREMAAHNNGYFGIDDVRYRTDPSNEASYFENHAAHVIKADYDLSVIFRDKALLTHSEAYWQKWNSCSNARCLRGCNVWGAPPSCQNSYTFTPCILRQVFPIADAACKQATSLANQAGKPLSVFALWLIFDRPDKLVHTPQ